MAKQRLASQRVHAATPRPTPESISEIPDPGLKQRAAETWRCASLLRSAMDEWWLWGLQLLETGDADPTVARSLAETCRVCVHALLVNLAPIRAFEGKTCNEIMEWFPKVPSAYRGWNQDPAYLYSLSIALGIANHAVWEQAIGQDSREELLKAWRSCEEAGERWHGIVGELFAFLQKLSLAPSAAFTPALAGGHVPDEDRPVRPADPLHDKSAPSPRFGPIEALSEGFTLGGQAFKLKGKSLALLRCLIWKKGKATKSSILRAVWPDDEFATDQMVWTQVNRLNDRLEKAIDAVGWRKSWLRLNRKRPILPNESGVELIYELQLPSADRTAEKL
jgi:hypothetical protein